MTTRICHHARWVVPVAAPVIENGSVVVEGNRIHWVGPRATAPSADISVDHGDAIITPGLVNAHTHLDLTVMRGFLEDLSFFDWIRTLTRARASVLTPDDLLHSSLLGVAEGLASGVTTFGDTSDSDAPLQAMLSLGVRGIAYREVFGPDPAQCDESMQLISGKIREMKLKADSSQLVSIGISPHAPYSVGDLLFEAVAAFASRENLPIAVHIAESREEDDLVVRGTGVFADFLVSRGIAVGPRAATPVALLGNAGLLRAGTLLIHGVHAGESDIRAVARSGCGLAHCPASNAKLGHGVAPVVGFLAAGVRVGLGSDSMASNNEMNILGEARLATFQQRAVHGRGDILSARAAFRLATLGGAEALFLDDRIGSLEVGKEADIVVFELSSLSSPSPDPVTALVMTQGGARVRHSWIGGKERVRDGTVLGLDESVPARVADASRRLCQWREGRSSH